MISLRTAFPPVTKPEDRDSVMKRRETAIEEAERNRGDAKANAQPESASDSFSLVGVLKALAKVEKENAEAGLKAFFKAHGLDDQIKMTRNLVGFSLRVPSAQVRQQVLALLKEEGPKTLEGFESVHGRLEVRGQTLAVIDTSQKVVREQDLKRGRPVLPYPVIPIHGRTNVVVSSSQPTESGSPPQRKGNLLRSTLAALGK